MIGLTGALAISSVLQWCALRDQVTLIKGSASDTGKLVTATQNLATAGQQQARAAGSQAAALDKLQAAGKAQADAANALRKAGEAQATSTAALAGSSVKQLTALTATAEAAKTQAGATVGQLGEMQLEQRPWLVGDAGIIQPITRDKGNNLTVAVRLVIRNIGHLPAFDVIPISKGVADFVFQGVVSKQRVLCQRNGLDLFHFGTTVFPGETVPVNMVVTVTPTEVQKLTARIGGELLPITFYGCISYHISGDSRPHSSFFDYNVMTTRMDDGSDSLQPLILPADPTRIPPGELLLMRGFEAGGFYAD